MFLVFQIIRNTVCNAVTVKWLLHNLQALSQTKLVIKKSATVPDAIFINITYRPSEKQTLLKYMIKCNFEQ